MYSRTANNISIVPFFFIIDKLIGYKLYFCRNERKEIFFVKKNTTDNTVFFDIGANIGIYTQMVASSFDKIKNSTIAQSDDSAKFPVPTVIPAGEKAGPFF